MYDFNFVSPTSVDEAAAAMKADGAQALGGGQTLLPTMKQRLASPETLVSLSSVADMVGVTASDGALTIGGATPHAQVASQASAYPALAALAGNIGDPAVRNRGTIGGSIANNDPAACYPAGVLGSGATVITNARSIDADDFFAGLFETAINDDEIVTSVRFPIPQTASYQKFEQPASRFALVGVFVAQYADGVRMAVTGASEGGVFRWSAAEDALSANFAVSSLDGISIDAEGMLADMHGSSAYRAHLIGVLAQRGVKACLG